MGRPSPEKDRQVLSFLTRRATSARGSFIRESDSSGKRSADAQLSFDKIRNDQTIAVRHLEGDQVAISPRCRFGTNRIRP